jgi:hypothetical protein
VNIGECLTWVGRLRLYWKPGRVAHLPDYLKVLGVENDTGIWLRKGKWNSSWRFGCGCVASIAVLPNLL